MEFASKDSRDNFLKEATQKEVEVQGQKVAVKHAKTEFFAKRDYSLGKAAELVKAEAQGRSVSVERNSRTVKVDTDVVFKQEKEDSGGTFSGEFSHLALS